MTAPHSTTADRRFLLGSLTSAAGIAAAFSPSISGNTGGLPLTPAGYDPSDNFTLV